MSTGLAQRFIEISSIQPARSYKHNQDCFTLSRCWELAQVLLFETPSMPGGEPTRATRQQPRIWTLVKSYQMQFIALVTNKTQHHTTYASSRMLNICLG